MVVITNFESTLIFIFERNMNNYCFQRIINVCKLCCLLENSDPTVALNTYSKQLITKWLFNFYCDYLKSNIAIAIVEM